MQQTPAVRIAGAGFVLIGWAGLLVPSLLRQVEAAFGVDDAAMGIWYFITASAYASGSLVGGLLTERLGRRIVLSAAAATLAVGLGIAGTASAWTAFVVAAVPIGLGSGTIDGGLNGLVLSVVASGRGRALNLLHVFFSIGALGAPLVIGRLVATGVGWQVPVLGAGLAALGLLGGLATVSMPSGRRDRAADPARTAEGSPALSGANGTRVSLPFLLLAIAIACYVAGEVGVSSWTVRFLSDVPLDVATLALSGFWAGLALGRVVTAAWGDRFSHAALAAGSSAVAGVAVIVAVATTSSGLSIAAIAVAGFASGPVFPLILALGGDLNRQRAAAVAGTLTAGGVVGGVLYPPLIGLVSGSVGLGAGLLGAGILSVVAAAAILAAVRLPVARTAVP